MRHYISNEISEQKEALKNDQSTNNNGYEDENGIKVPKLPSKNKNKELTQSFKSTKDDSDRDGALENYNSPVNVKKRDLKAVNKEENNESGIDYSTNEPTSSDTKTQNGNENLRNLSRSARKRRNKRLRKMNRAVNNQPKSNSTSKKFDNLVKKIVSGDNSGNG